MRDPFTEPPDPTTAGKTKRDVPASINAAAKVFFLVLVGTAATVLVAVSVALWRWII